LKRITQIADDFILHDNAAEFPSAFPLTTQLVSERKRDLWKMQNVLTHIVEFGTADWQGRVLDTILVQLQVNSENAALGRYVTDCMVVGYLIDTEFGCKSAWGLDGDRRAKPLKSL
jgi:hypothetical protein